MFSAKFNMFKKIVAAGGGGFTPVAYVITSGTSRAVPTGATSMKAWVIGGGSGGTYDTSGCVGADDGYYGGESVRTYVVTGGATVTYTIGAAGVQGDCESTSGGNTTLTYSGVTITGAGGIGNYVLGGNGLGNNGVGSGGNFNRTFYASGTLDFQGRVAAVTLAGSSLNAGFKGVAGISSGTNAQNTATNGAPGGIVLYFT